MKKDKITLEDLALMVKNGFDELGNEIKDVKQDISIIKDEIVAMNSESSGLRSKQMDHAEVINELQSEIHGFKIEWPHIAYKQDLEKLERKMTVGK